MSIIILKSQFYVSIAKSNKKGVFMNLKSIITVMALILIMFMAAIETSIISLALPTIKIV